MIGSVGNNSYTGHLQNPSMINSIIGTPQNNNNNNLNLTNQLYSANPSMIRSVSTPNSFLNNNMFKENVNIMNGVAVEKNNIDGEVQNVLQR